MAIPTRTNRFFRTTNVLYDEMTSSNFWLQNYAADPILSADETVNGVPITYTKLHNDTYYTGANRAAPYGTQSFLYKAGLYLNTTRVTINWFQRINSETSFYQFVQWQGSYPAHYQRWSTLGKVYGGVGGTSWAQDSTAYDHPFTDAKNWNMYTYVLDGAEVRLYLNAELKQTTNHTTTSSVDFSFGAYRNTTWAALTDYYDAGIWQTVALDQTQIQELFDESFLNPAAPIAKIDGSSDDNISIGGSALNTLTIN